MEKNNTRAKKLFIGRTIFVILSIIIFYFVAFQKNVSIAKLESENQKLSEKIERMELFIKEKGFEYKDKVEEKKSEEVEKKENKKVDDEKVEEKLNSDLENIEEDNKKENKSEN